MRACVPVCMLTCMHACIRVCVCVCVCVCMCEHTCVPAFVFMLLHMHSGHCTCLQSMRKHALSTPCNARYEHVDVLHCQLDLQALLRPHRELSVQLDMYPSSVPQEKCLGGLTTALISLKMICIAIVFTRHLVCTCAAAGKYTGPPTGTRTRCTHARAHAGTHVRTHARTRARARARACTQTPMRPRIHAPTLLSMQPSALPLDRRGWGGARVRVRARARVHAWARAAHGHGRAHARLHMHACTCMHARHVRGCNAGGGDYWRQSTLSAALLQGQSATRHDEPSLHSSL